MWNLINCYLSGRHEYGAWCEPGAMFLRCVHCGKRSPGWAVEPKFQTSAPRPPVATRTISQPARRVLPFDRAAAS